MRRRTKILGLVIAVATAVLVAFGTQAGQDLYISFKDWLQRPSLPREATEKLDFENFDHRTPLEAQVQERGILFQNTIVENLRYPVSGQRGIRSADGSKPIVIGFPACASSVRIRIDADGHDSDRQPQAWAYNKSGQRILTKNFGGGKSQVVISSGVPIAKVELGAVPRRGHAYLKGSDAFDDLEVDLLRSCG